jgi:arginyl-tRNA synthetase
MTDNIFADIREAVVAALAVIVPDLPADIAARVEVTPTKDPAHGDMATNAAMVASKAARRKPQEIAAELVAALSGFRESHAAGGRVARAIADHPA